MNVDTSSKMPAIFFGHGSPINVIAENDYTQALRSLGKNLPKPKAIVMISAHWETTGTWITGMQHPKTIHDFAGFSDELYAVQYPAQGLPILAEEIAAMLVDQNITVDRNKWGLDHGTWAVLRHVYPHADVPVLQLSLDQNQPPAFHYALGQKLALLRKQEVMLMGSGNIVHNLRKINWDTDAKPYDWVVAFDHWVKDKIITRDFQPLIADVETMPEAKLSIPTWEHYLPLLYILGASNEKDMIDFIFEGYQNASMSMRCLRFS
ncbi:MAG: 4,5-DOPA dioxygenase extradiol [Deltaproteobacteria bacterium]|nr:4,5-DOPA dioxygenase extradiol [Deltaproteobacteria bacterium]